MIKGEISEHIDPLDGVFVGRKLLDKPEVLLSHELLYPIIDPQHVHVFWV